MHTNNGTLLNQITPIHLVFPDFRKSDKTYTMPAQMCTTQTGNRSIDSFLGLVSTSADKNAVVVDALKDYWLKNAEIARAGSGVLWFVDSLRAPGS